MIAVLKDPAHYPSRKRVAETRKIYDPSGRLHNDYFRDLLAEDDSAIGH